MQNNLLNINLLQFAPKIEGTSDTLAQIDRWQSLSKSTIQPFNHSANLIILPEMFATGFTFEKDLAQPMNGETVMWMIDTAKRLNSAIYGSVLISENNKLYNRGIFVFPNGDFETYDKRHCFRMSEEPQHVTAGDKIVTVNYADWNIRLSICYDLRFPVWLRNTYKNGQYDYDILLNVASWPDSRAHVWRTLLHARAIENQAYCIGVNRVGKDKNEQTYRGYSMVVDAKGTALGMGNPNKEQVINVQINKSTLTEFREKFCVGKDWDTYEIEK